MSDLCPALVVPMKGRAVPEATVIDWLIVFTHMDAYWQATANPVPNPDPSPANGSRGKGATAWAVRNQVIHYA